MTDHPTRASGDADATDLAMPATGAGGNPRLAAALAGRYRLGRLLGAGGMAMVYLAEDRKHGRAVAIKVLRQDLAESLGRDRFLREIQLAARLTHPHILPLYDSGEADGILYFVMPVMQGQTLRERLVARRSLPLDDALRIAAEVADALDYAHRQDIVHRDIKPENILLHEGHAIVADFGIGKALAAAAVGDATVTQMGVMVGTPAYLSPEQAAGDTLDGRSDLFALGCVLYEMLAGELAFSGPTVQAIIAKRLTESPPAVTDRRSDVPAAIAAAVARLLTRDPQARFATGAEVVAVLRSTPISVAVVPAEPLKAGKSIAVLPFSNVGGDPENEFLSDGLTEEIITDLATVQALRVISRSSSLHLKDTTKGMREVGRLLGVRYAVTGGVRRAGDSLRITAQLVDTTNDEQLWAEKFSGTMADVFDVQERVSRAIVGALKVTLSSTEDARLAERPLRNAMAFELYLKAQALVRRYGASMDQVLELLQRAEAIEGPALPIRALRAYVDVMQMRAGMATGPEHLARAEAEALSLVREAPQAPYGYALLGYIAYERGDLATTVRQLSMALERDASDADATFFLGIAVEAAGQVERAIVVAHRFIEADPLSPMAGILLGSVYWFAGRPAERLDAIEHAAMLDADNPIVRWTLGYTYALLGRVDDARRQVDWMLRHAPAMPYSAHLAGLVLALEGRKDDALGALAGIAAIPFDAHLTFHLSEAFAMAGAHDVALRLAADAVERGFYPSTFIERHCPFLEPIRGTEAFARVAARARQRVAEFRG
ncbi:MAG TPA: protein kinase [Vicinamibacterales bacterium]|nr:protein kinase [Vicinamibacterales bacterium]